MQTDTIWTFTIGRILCDWQWTHRKNPRSSETCSYIHLPLCIQLLLWVWLYGGYIGYRWRLKLKPSAVFDCDHWPVRPDNNQKELACKNMKELFESCCITSLNCIPYFSHSLVVFWCVLVYYILRLKCIIITLHFKWGKSSIFKCIFWHTVSRIGLLTSYNISVFNNMAWRLVLQ